MAFVISQHYSDIYRLVVKVQYFPRLGGSGAIFTWYLVDDKL